MIKINLLGDTLAQAATKKPDRGEPAQDFRDPELGRSSFPIAGVLLGVLLPCVGGVYYIWLNGQVEQATQTRDALQAKKQELDKYIQLEKTFRAQKDSLEKKKQVMLGLKTYQHLPVHLLEELANAMPDDVWFKEINQ